MIRLNNLLFGLIFTILLSGCEKNGNEILSSDFEYIKYGTSFGECIGYCKNDMTITNSTIDFHKSGWDLDGLLPEISNSENVNTKYVSELNDLIDFDSFLQLDSIIGCPDCADGGAEWIEIKRNEKSHKVIFEYRNEPGEAREYIGFLRTYLNTFQVDPNESVDFNERAIINQSGFIKNIVATRGSYQWLIGILDGGDTTYYFDKYIDSDFQLDGLKIKFHGVLEYDSTVINKPAPNDVPIPDFKVRNIRTFDMKAIN